MEASQSAMAQDEPAELTLRDLFGVLTDAWVGILVLTVVGGVAAGTIAYLQKPTYRAEALLSATTTQDAQLSSLGRLAEQFAPGLATGVDSVGGFTGKDVWVATLRSRRLTEEFIDDRDLLPVLFAERWDSDAGTWKMGKNGKPSVPTMHSAFVLFNKNILKVTEDVRTGLITLAVEWRDPEMAADWANDLVARANEFIRARMISEAQQSISFLEAELKKTDVVALQQAIYRLIESKISDVVVANVRKEYAFAVVDPAVAPPSWDFVRPRRRFITAFGLALGLLAGIVYAGIRRVSVSTRATPDRHGTAAAMQSFD